MDHRGTDFMTKENVLHRGLCLIFNESKNHKTFVDRKTKTWFLLSLLCHHRYCIFDGKVLCIMRGAYSMVCTIKSLTNIEAFQEKMFLY